MNLRETWQRIGINPRSLAVLLIGFAVVLFVVLPLARFWGYTNMPFPCPRSSLVAFVAKR
jgi:hypothetical protein